MRLFIFRVLPEALVAPLYYPPLMDGLARGSLSDVKRFHSFPLYV